MKAEEYGIDKEKVIKDIVKRVNFFTKKRYRESYVEGVVREVSRDLDFKQKEIADFGTNRIAKEILGRLSERGDE